MLVTQKVTGLMCVTF